LSHELEDLPPDNAAPLWAQVQLLTKQRNILETALLKIAHQDAKLTWARGVARAALDASFLLTKESSDA
jgi:hypothetical protein